MGEDGKVRDKSLSKNKPRSSSNSSKGSGDSSSGITAANDP